MASNGFVCDRLLAHKKRIYRHVNFASLCITGFVILGVSGQTLINPFLRIIVKFTLQNGN